MRNFNQELFLLISIFPYKDLNYRVILHNQYPTSYALCDKL